MICLLVKCEEMYQSPQIKSSLSNGSHADQKKSDLTTWNYLKVDGDRHSQVRWISFRGHDFHQDVHGSGDRHRSFPGGIFETNGSCQDGRILIARQKQSLSQVGWSFLDTGCRA